MSDKDISRGASSSDTSFRLTAPLPRNLFSDQAEEAAQRCSCAGGNRNKSAQIRRFYDELVMWSELVQQEAAENREARFREVEPYIQMLRAKAAYAKGRDLIDDNFRELLERIVRNINSPESLENGKLFFEAFLGFKKYYEE